MANNRDFLRQCLEFTLVPDKTRRQEGEKSLKQFEQNADFGQLLVSIIDDGSCELPIRMAATVTLKNYVRKYWPEPDKAEDLLVPPATCAYLKQELVPLMYRVPHSIQKNISETINSIAWIDFPANWQRLLPDLTASFDAGEIDPILASLRTAHGLFKHYRVAYESKALWKEILHVLDEFAPKFTKLFLTILAQIPNLERLSREGGDQTAATATLKNAFHIILLCCKIFHSLIFQELPEVFVQELRGWLQKFSELLDYENNDLRSDNDDEPGVLNNIKSEICDILTLLAFKYDDDFDPYAAQFVRAVITLLMKTTQLMQDDLLAFSSMEFLSRVLAQNKCRDVFSGEGFLEAVCEKIVIPNIQFRQSDADDFDSNPEEFIRRDIEGSDIHTRRRAAADLVRAANKFHEERVTKCLLTYIENLIIEYQKDSRLYWKLKDSAIFLTAALAAKGQVARFGATAINPLVDVVSFCQRHVAPHIQSGPGDQPVLQADCLKFLVTFRAQLPVESLISCFPAVVLQLDSPYMVVHTYAAHCLERIFSMKDTTTGLFRITPDQLRPYLGSLDNTPFNPAAPNTLFSHLLAFRLISPPDNENPDGRLDENEYTMKCIMRALSFFQLSEILPHFQYIVPQLMKRIAYAIKNPGNARYDHYLFESLALCIGIACRADARAVEVFEKELIPAATVVLQNSVDAFFPYVFQLFAQLLENRAGSSLIPSEYMMLLDPLLNPQLLRDNETQVPSVVRLLGAYFEANASQVVGRLENALGLFKILVSSKKYDHEGFNLLRPIIDKTPLDSLKGYLTGIFNQFFERLMRSKTDKFVKNLVPTLYLMVVRLGAATFIQSADEVQKNIFAMLLDRIMLPEVLKVQRRLTRKLCVVGCVALLTDTAKVLGGPYDGIWKNILETCVKLIELPPEKETIEDLHSFDLTNDDPTSGPLPTQATSQNQLVFAKKAEKDHVSDVSDVKVFLATKLAALSATRPGMVRAKLQDSIPDVQTFVGAYCQMAGVTIN
ncbi:exportin-2-like [Paramacrobiotus metropolitanus]|uniref:exportin-2-like n=1 Tax=Paramacrobiotus metropolitanus TaxID=2943436 RepID=UPI002445C940|nr:exportin-2-like [Paramacrobiotus metropolitanus]